MKSPCKRMTEISMQTMAPEVRKRQNGRTTLAKAAVSEDGEVKNFLTLRAIVEHEPCALDASKPLQTANGEPTEHAQVVADALSTVVPGGLSDVESRLSDLIEDYRQGPPAAATARSERADWERSMHVKIRTLEWLAKHDDRQDIQWRFY